MYNQAAANQLRAEGKDMWWYICIGPYRSAGYINFFVEYPAIEPRLLMGLMAYKYQTGGFLYYNIARWLTAFHQRTAGLRPGRTRTGIRGAMRMLTRPTPMATAVCSAPGPMGQSPPSGSENIRDGLEDYEYLKLLEDLVTTMSAISPPTAEQLAWTQLGPTTAGGAVEPRRLRDLVHAGYGGAGELSRTVSCGHSDRQSVDRASPARS